MRTAMLLAAALAGPFCAAAEAPADRAVALMKKGVTLPLELTAALTPAMDPKDRPKKDTGINILVDQAHQTQFAVLWGMSGEMRGMGHRVSTSCAALDSVLVPGKPNRIRKQIGDLEPFAWWPAATFNVVVTDQQDLNAQPYTPMEIDTLARFVQAGGGLMVFAGRPDQSRVDNWSLNTLLNRFGATITAEQDKVDGQKRAVLALGKEWTVDIVGTAQKPLRARRIQGKGRVMVMERRDLITKVKDETAVAFAKRTAAFDELLRWLAGGKPPVGGDWRLPNTGGVGIFPEKEQNLGSVVVSYASNQTADALACIEKDIPAAAKQILEWFPCATYEEPYHLVICAGGGGGWAINPRPKAAAVIEYQPLSILGVFAHEMAHTKGGPTSPKGELAGSFPHGNQGEEHAGWFQGKITAQFNPPDRTRSNRDCNSILALEKKKGRLLDLAKYDHEFWGKGPNWTKMWWAWQKIEDRYGTTWYPRWYWVRNQRWQDDPKHRESWDEMVEDMSIAAGEDLAPFFVAIGTTLEVKRRERTTFLGTALELPTAPLDTGPAGNVHLDPIGDFTKPLPPARR